jgi:hypothetical protein
MSSTPLYLSLPGCFPSWLMLGSGVLASLSHQGCDKGAEEGFAAAPSVVHELEESEVER